MEFMSSPPGPMETADLNAAGDTNESPTIFFPSVEFPATTSATSGSENNDGDVTLVEMRHVQPESDDTQPDDINRQFPAGTEAQVDEEQSRGKQMPDNLEAPPGLQVQEDKDEDTKLCPADATSFLSTSDLAIELIKGKTAVRRPARRSASGSPDDDTKQFRIRINSRILLDVLHNATKTDIGHEHTTGSSPISMDFLYPFKLFAWFEEDIRDYIKDFNILMDDFKAQYTTEEVNRDLQAFVDLLDNGLKAFFTLYRSLQSDKPETICFEDLWMLYKPNDIAYERREPSDHDTFLSTPRLWQIVQYGGGREILNNNKFTGTNPSIPLLTGRYHKGKTGQFYIRGFCLDSDMTVVEHETAWSIPPWGGERRIHELKLFPIRFCRHGRDFEEESFEAWETRLIKAGKIFCKLRPGKARYLKGMGVDEKGIEWEYHSEVVIDIARARRDAPELFSSSDSRMKRLLTLLNAGQISAGKTLSILDGDKREVVEETTSVKNQIHDDVALNEQIFDTRLVVPDFSNLNSEDRRTFLLFPRVVSGFVLSARKWVNFKLTNTTHVVYNRELWKELHLPHGHKKAILAEMMNHIRSEGTIAQFDSISTKGAGVIMLLQGHPGTGKTFTAEALAAYTGRNLYSITSGELGETVSGIEQRLQVILERGRNWGCIILLNEADVYLTKRSQGELQRNSIVSVFLRLLEFYPGVMILTSNRTMDFDDALLSRFSLRLMYPPLNRDAVSRIWQLYCSKVETGHFVADHGDGRPTIKIETAVYQWWEKHYDAATKTPSPVPWWSGRDIQIAFRRAVVVAVYEQWLAKRSQVRTRNEEKRKSLCEKLEKLKSRANRPLIRIQAIGRDIRGLPKPPDRLDKHDVVMVMAKHFDAYLEGVNDFKDVSRMMHDSDNNEVGTEAPREGVKYDDELLEYCNSEYGSESTYEEEDDKEEAQEEGTQNPAGTSPSNTMP